MSRRRIVETEARLVGREPHTQKELHAGADGVVYRDPAPVGTERAIQSRHVKVAIQ